MLRNLCPSRHHNPGPSTGCRAPKEEGQPAHHCCPPNPLFPTHVGRGLPERTTSARGRAAAAPKAAAASPVPSPLPLHAFQTHWRHRRRLDVFDDSKGLCQDKRTALSQAFKTRLETTLCLLGAQTVHPLLLS